MVCAELETMPDGSCAELEIMPDGSCADEEYIPELCKLTRVCAEPDTIPVFTIASKMADCVTYDAVVEYELDREYEELIDELAHDEEMAEFEYDAVEAYEALIDCDAHDAVAGSLSVRAYDAVSAISA